MENSPQTLPEKFHVISSSLFRSLCMGKDTINDPDEMSIISYSFHLYFRSSHHFILFHSFHGLMNSINWPASSVWVFIAQAGRALQR